jgi:hypothetical protein
VALFRFLDEMSGRQQVDRALFEGVTDEWLAYDDIRAAHAEVLGVLGELLARAQRAGAARADVSAVDVLVMLKGACQSAAAFSHIDPEMLARQVDLILSGLRVPAVSQPLRGRAPTVEDLEQAFPPPDGEQLKTG